MSRRLDEKTRAHNVIKVGTWLDGRARLDGEAEDTRFRCADGRSSSVGAPIDKPESRARVKFRARLAERDMVVRSQESEAQALVGSHDRLTSALNAKRPDADSNLQ
jgi:hypothetical protein